MPTVRQWWTLANIRFEILKNDASVDDSKDELSIVSSFNSFIIHSSIFAFLRRQCMFSSTITRLRQRQDDELISGGDAGFTLIELMVVLLILAILLAIAIPTFLGVTKSANDRAVQSNLNTALVNAKSIFQTNSQSYIAPGNTANAAYLVTNNQALATSLGSAEADLNFATSAVTNGGSQATVSVAVAQDGNGLVLAEQAKGTNNCWFVVDNSVTETTTTGGATYTTMPSAQLATGTFYGVVKNASTCNASAVPSTATFQSTGFPPS
jgi:type IV pilus assembly protein PilA